MSVLLALLGISLAAKAPAEKSTTTVGVGATGATTPEPDAPNLPSLYVKYLETEGGTKPTKAALQQLRDAVKASPDDSLAHAVLGLASLKHSSGSKKADDKEGVRHLKEALALAPSALTQVHPLLANALQERSRRDLTDRFSHKEALKLYQTGMRLLPRDTESYFQLGRLHALYDGKTPMGRDVEGYKHSHFVGGEEDEVTTLWKQAAEIAPTSWRINHALSGRLTHSRKKTLRKEAVKYAEVAVEDKPQRATSHAALAAAHMRLPKPLAEGRISHEDATQLGPAARQLAIGSLRRCVRADQQKHVSHADCYYELGMLIFTTPGKKQGEVPVHMMNEAHRHLQYALKLKPKDALFERAEKNMRQFLTNSEVKRQQSDLDDDDDDDDE